MGTTNKDKVSGHFMVTFVIRQLHFSSVVLGVDLRTDTKNDVYLKEIGLHAQYLFAILGLIVTIMGGGPI